MSFVNVPTSFLQPNIFLKSVLVSSFSSEGIFSKLGSFEVTNILEEQNIGSVTGEVEFNKASRREKNFLRRK